MLGGMIFPRYSIGNIIRLKVDNFIILIESCFYPKLCLTVGR